MVSVHQSTGILLCLTLLMLSACAQQRTDAAVAQWDFDHNVQYQQKPLGEHSYYLSVRANNKTHFSKLATFLLRKSYELCHSYGFKLEVLAGVEGFYDRQAFPNLIMDSLAANVECPNDR
jgi:hypothetical protein